MTPDAPVDPAEPDSGMSPALAASHGGDGAHAFEPALGGVAEIMRAARAAPWRWARIEALIRLGRFDDPRVRQALEAGARDDDWVSRKYAVSGLSALGAGPSLAVVRQALSDPHNEVRRAAARALRSVDVGDRLEDWLLACDDPDWMVRAAALSGLAGYPEGDRLPPCLAALGDSAWLCRYMALAALSTADDPRVLPALVAAMQADPALAPHGGEALSARWPEALPLLLPLLAGAPPWLRLAIVPVLGAADDLAARSALAAMLGYPDPEVEQAVIRQGSAMRPHLLVALAAEAWTVRWHACRLLGRLPEGSAVPLLPLVQDARPEVRLAALEALTALGEPSALPDLTQCLSDPSWHVRLRAVQALGTLHGGGLAEAGTLLTGALTDPRDEVREAARRHLGRGA